MREAVCCGSIALVERRNPDPPRAYSAWAPEEDQLLREMFRAGERTVDMAAALQRSCGGIRGRLRRLGLIA